MGKKQNLKSSNNINVVALSKIVKEHKVVFNTALSLWYVRLRTFFNDKACFEMVFRIANDSVFRSFKSIVSMLNLLYSFTNRIPFFS